MIKINGMVFYDRPGSCGTCPFFCSGNSNLVHVDKGLCTLFNENHAPWINPPRRCAKLFNKAMKYADGTELVITQNEQDNE